MPKRFFQEPVSRSIKFGSPFLVLTEGGCSATTPILGRFLHKIVQTHGYKILTNTEMLNVHQGKKKKNKYYFDILMDKNVTHKSLARHKQIEILVESIKQAQKVAIESESLIVFKINYYQFREMHSHLESLEGGVSYIGLYRENLLDRCTCMLKDCFDDSKEFGNSVFENGTESKLCFQRRKHPEFIVQAYFTNVQQCLAESEEHVTVIQNHGCDSISSELLTLFEYSTNEHDFNLSIDAWMIFLKQLLKDELKRELVMQSLEEFRGSRKHSNQTRSVYNYHQVRQNLTGIAEWEKFLD